MSINNVELVELVLWILFSFSFELSVGRVLGPSSLHRFASPSPLFGLWCPAAALESTLQFFRPRYYCSAYHGLLANWNSHIRLNYRSPNIFKCCVIHSGAIWSQKGPAGRRLGRMNNPWCALGRYHNLKVPINYPPGWQISFAKGVNE